VVCHLHSLCSNSRRYWHNFFCTHQLPDWLTSVYPFLPKFCQRWTTTSPKWGAKSTHQEQIHDAWSYVANMTEDIDKISFAYEWCHLSPNYFGPVIIIIVDVCCYWQASPWILISDGTVKQLPADYVLYAVQSFGKHNWQLEQRVAHSNSNSVTRAQPHLYTHIRMQMMYRTAMDSRCIHITWYKDVFQYSRRHQVNGMAPNRPWIPSETM